MVLSLCFFFLDTIAPSSVVPPSFTEPGFQRLPQEIDSSDDDVLWAWSELLCLSAPHTTDNFTSGVRQTAASTDLPPAGSSAWVPMTADEFHASASSVPSLSHRAGASASSVPSVSHRAGQPFGSDNFETHYSGRSDSSESDDPDVFANVDSSEDDDSNIATDVHSSPPLPPGANPLDYLSRGATAFFSFCSPFDSFFFTFCLYAMLHVCIVLFRSSYNSLRVCTPKSL